LDVETGFSYRSIDRSIRYYNVRYKRIVLVLKHRVVLKI